MNSPFASPAAFERALPDGRVETEAGNRRPTLADTLNQTPGKEVPLLNDPKKKPTTTQKTPLSRPDILEIREIFAKAGLKCKISSDAGRQVCESTVYELIEAAKDGRIGSGIFVHTPQTLSDSDMSGLPKTIDDLLKKLRDNLPPGNE